MHHLPNWLDGVAIETEYAYSAQASYEDEITLRNNPNGTGFTGSYRDESGSVGTITGLSLHVSSHPARVTATFGWSETGYRGVETIEYTRAGDGTVTARGVFWEDGREGRRFGREDSR